MKNGLGMRYAFLGPLETCHLNVEGKFSSGSLLLPYFFFIYFFWGGLQKTNASPFIGLRKRWKQFSSFDMSYSDACVSSASFTLNSVRDPSHMLTMRNTGLRELD